MKRIVLCCDGTWNSPVRESVSNVEKIARAVATGIVGDGVVQEVHTVGGVGSRGYLLDRVLGGAFGYGITTNVVEGYREIALGYSPGDEIFVFGFSRGAYTARSVVGMIAAVGLLRPEAVLENRLREAERLYRERSDATADVRAAFRREHAYASVPVRMLGVFDTVGALGVPGLTRRRSRFHDVRLGRDVVCARQALAIDERRRTFEPCLWEVPEAEARPGRVKQVWFPGVHSDVGGSTRHTALSDVTLRWMVGEAESQGLVVDHARLAAQLEDEPVFEVVGAPTPLWRCINLVKRVRRNPRFRGDVRVLAGVPAREGPGYRDEARIAWPALRLTADDADPAYREHAVNVGWWRESAGAGLDGLVEHVRDLDGDRRRVVLV
ncbi:putative alpha/beta hydrolase family protein DUF2235 [Sediminihabitans luteus]|uniref:Putative alpha/beta hydrolase family protein DUF2235 n=1 Tax=Sediminihabitans luteus TaxID=1138585 RepID=A0A2M9CYR6_9CELL|nr:DUF2235 domain-containing protein [Sediminihabitans luteus]PJJ77081.1 putative alpha/beta hydrolase family protein DUF2235 [Sediminihabitans luteus]GIJ00400.1 hypothetical protein Slu03_27770 [Sediminihabitans luteus]